MPYCIVRAYTHDEYLSPPAEFAAFKVTKNLVRVAESRCWQVKEMDIMPFAVEFSDYTPVFLEDTFMREGKYTDQIDFEKLLEPVLEGKTDHIFVKEFPEPLWNEILGKSDFRTDCMVMCIWGISPDKVSWKGYIKHTPIEVSTRCVGLSDLKGALEKA
ncbi:MAG: hypothetical protein JXB42_10405 [Deltaproteobacteria bacterium]|nr:hypothetical protein [Deltaproteobacteria bacterium]